MSLRALVVTIVVAACSPGDRAPSTAPGGGVHGASGASDAGAAPRREGGRAADAATAATLASQPGGADLTPQALRIYRIAACGGAAPLPPEADAAIVERHCRRVAGDRTEFRTRWLDVAGPYLARLRPAALPDAVIYPFGGGDLVTALATFPAALEYTTISLEPTGSPRAIDDAAALRSNLDGVYRFIDYTLRGAWNSTENLDRVAHGELPGELVLALVGMDVMGYEPLSLRYLTLSADGSVRYLEEGELAAAPAAVANGGPATPGGLVTPSPWNHAEIRFRRQGDAGAPVKVFRHFAADLSDRAFAGSPLARHLEAKGPIAAMTKAAHYLLWKDAFSSIRGFLLGHMVWMISDSTGFPPRLARQAGFVQEAFGHYRGAYFEDVRDRPADEADLRRLWAEGDPDLPFLYGYFDLDRRAHLMITRRPEARPAGAAPPASGAAAADPITLAAVGDVIFARYRAGGDTWARTTAAAPFARVAGLLSSADLAFANVETPIRSAPARLVPCRMCFRADPRDAGTLAAAGLDVVSIANNHALNGAPGAPAETRAHLEAAGVRAIGGGATPAEAGRPVLVERGGRRVAFLACTTLLNDAPSAGAVAHAPDGLAGVEAAVRAARRYLGADFVVVSLHWGDEDAPAPSAAQRAAARGLVDAGADVVLGHHPHVWQEVERVRGAIVAYSLGNFLFDNPRLEWRETAIVRVALTGVGPLRSAEPAGLVPVLISQGRVAPAVGADGARLARRLAALAPGWSIDAAGR